MLLSLEDLGLEAQGHKNGHHGAKNKVVLCVLLGLRQGRLSLYI